MKKKVILSILGAVAITLFFGVFLYFMVKFDNEQAKEYEEKMTLLKRCKKDNSEKILQFVKDCTSNLKVEEQAYAIETCEDVIIRTICN